MQVATVVMLLAGLQLASLFVKPEDTALLTMSITAIKIFSFSYLVGWMDSCFSSFFTALGRTRLHKGQPGVFVRIR